jgi:hypothetical protein
MTVKLRFDSTQNIVLLLKSTSCTCATILVLFQLEEVTLPRNNCQIIRAFANGYRAVAILRMHQAVLLLDPSGYNQPIRR